MLGEDFSQSHKRFVTKFARSQGLGFYINSSWFIFPIFHTKPNIDSSFDIPTILKITRMK